MAGHMASGDTASGQAESGHTTSGSPPSPDLATNPTAGLVYVVFWVGLIPASLLFGPIWKLLNPLRTIHLALFRLLRVDPAEPPLRLTLTLPALTRAANISVLVAGSKKANALQNVLAEIPDPNIYPAAGLRATEGTLIWWADREAAVQYANGSR